MISFFKIKAQYSKNQKDIITEMKHFTYLAIASDVRCSNEKFDLCPLIQLYRNIEMMMNTFKLQ